MCQAFWGVVGWSQTLSMLEGYGESRRCLIETPQVNWPISIKAPFWPATATGHSTPQNHATAQRICLIPKVRSNETPGLARVARQRGTRRQSWRRPIPIGRGGPRWMQRGFRRDQNLHPFGRCKLHRAPATMHSFRPRTSLDTTKLKVSPVTQRSRLTGRGSLASLDAMKGWGIHR